MSSFDLAQRASGILLHPTSLPGPHGCGDLGSGARAFVDFLAAAGQRWWQLLPINPVGGGDSPYSGSSAFAGSPLLIDVHALVEDGLVETSELGDGETRTEHVDYRRAFAERERLLRLAFDRFCERPAAEEQLAGFEERASAWLPDYALFAALRRHHGGKSWVDWAEPLARREKKALAEARRTLEREARYVVFEQMVFAAQWQKLRDYCHSLGVGLIGDVPIFVAHDSADVWAHAEQFRLDERGNPTVVAGVPPDYFSKTGQRWGNPLYRWKHMRRGGYTWWVERMRCALQRFDALRLDHFIGFRHYWEVSADEKTAENGRWMKGPGRALFVALEGALGKLPLIAEDLGSVDDRVRKLRDDLELPGMSVLQFAFGDGAESFQPHNYPKRTVAYTGTHDNDTALGWYFDKGGEGMRPPEQAERERVAARLYLTGRSAPEADHEIEWAMIRSLYESRANLVMLPMQDVLGLPSTARMNVPGLEAGNWRWRLDPSQLTPPLSERLHELAKLFGRLPAA